jgi:hypothetical protein
MTRLIAIFFAVASAAASASGQGFSAKETALLDELRFDRETVAAFKPGMRSEIRRMERISVAYDTTANSVSEERHPLNGVSFDVDPGAAKRIVLDLRKSAREKGYLAFVSEDSFGRGNDSISIIKSASQFDIISFMQTDGINYEITNAQVIAKLKEWNSRYPFEIIGAGLDWVDAIFVKKPADMFPLAKEVYQFCPDAARGASLDALAERMKKLNQLYLKWD